MLFRIKRKMVEEETVKTPENNVDEYLPHCQAIFDSRGHIILRNYDRSNRSKEEIIILSSAETEALFALFSSIGQKNQNYKLPF